MSNRPHGGRLINRVLEGQARQQWQARAEQLPRLQLNPRQVSDVELIAVGAFSPLEGFMGWRDYESVLAQQRLASGLPWTIPITLAVTQEEVQRLGEAEELALADSQGHVRAVLHLEEVFQYDREREAQTVLLTASNLHPGVRYLDSVGDYCLAGAVSLLERPDRGPFAKYTLDPKETRFLFNHRRWHTIVAFQTRNPIHRAHEYMLRCALETVEGLLLHPLVGATQEEDVPAEVRVECYLALLRNALPSRHCVLSLYPAAMRYAGPREAIFHALVRKNYGCTHFIVGRDHAGVGNFYGPFDAQRKFSEFEPGELGITPLFFGATFYCKTCGQVASEKTCPHGPQERLILSGTRVRELLRDGQELPPEFTRPEVAEILRQAYHQKELDGKVPGSPPSTTDR